MEAHWVEKIPNLDLSDKKNSQFGEVNIVEFILNETLACLPPNFLVDIGAGGAGIGISNSKYFIDNGWDGLLFDIDGSKGTIKEFITPFNIVDLLKKHSCPKKFDFLNIDIDSFDYDVLDAVLSEYAPRIICSEFNGCLDPKSKVKLKYEDGYTWNGSDKYGYSLYAGIDLFEKYGYKVIYNQQETNLFAVKKELLPKGFKKEIIGVQMHYHWHDKTAEWINL